MRYPKREKKLPEKARRRQDPRQPAVSQILKNQPKLWYKKIVEGDRCCDHIIVTLYITTSLPVRIYEFVITH
jgi:hypothetical protein